MNTKPQRVESILLIHKNQDLWRKECWANTKNFFLSNLEYLENMSSGKASQICLMKQNAKKHGKWTPKDQF